MAVGKTKTRRHDNLRSQSIGQHKTGFDMAGHFFVKLPSEYRSLLNCFPRKWVREGLLGGNNSWHIYCPL